MQDIKTEKPPQGCYKTMQLSFCDIHYNNIMDFKMDYRVHKWFILNNCMFFFITMLLETALLASFQVN